MVHLVVQTAFVGDLLLSIPLIKRLRKLYPGDEIALLCRKGLGSLFKDLGLVNHFFEWDKSSAEWPQVRKDLRRGKYGLVVCPHQSFRSALLVRNLKVQNSLGFSRPWNFWAFKKRRARPMEWPEALRQLSLLTLVDNELKIQFSELLEGHKNVSTKTQVDFRKAPAIPLWSSMEISSLIGQTRHPVVFMAPGSVWPTKRWLEQGYIEVGKRIQSEGFQVHLVGSPEERELCARIQNALPGSKNWAGEGRLLDTLKLFSHGRALITNDNGAMHMAAAAGLPTVAIFGPTVLEFGYRPWQSRAIVVQKAWDCRPCGLHGAETCPLSTHDCMKSVTSDEVTAALLGLL